MDIDEENHELVTLFDKIVALDSSKHQEIIDGYQNILKSDLRDDQAVRVKEQAIYNLGDLLAATGKAKELNQLLREVRPFFTYVPKAKTAKIVRKLFDLVAQETVGNTVDQQIAVCEESIDWSRQEKRTFLRHRLQTRLADLYFQKQAYQPALTTLNSLLREVRRLDDKQLLVDIQLLESKVYQRLRNLSKSKAALVASRTAANAIYCPPLQQAALDLQSGILNAQEKDFKTGYSYFYEAFETQHQYGTTEKDAKRALKYMLLCRIMSNNVDEVSQILSSKNVLRYTGREIDAMKGVAAAYKARDLHEFEKVREEHKAELESDPIVASHLSDLYDSMLEQHLIRVIEPYCEVQLNHISKKVKLDVGLVEDKLSQMILDKKLNGTIDQANLCLIVFESDQPDACYPAALSTVDNMSKVIDALLDKWHGKFEKVDEGKKDEEKDKKDEKKDEKKDKDAKKETKKEEKK
jgi:26S proteasome regulatory subunit N6